ncbi:hypothetical protein [Nostoc sp.]
MQSIRQRRRNRHRLREKQNQIKYPICLVLNIDVTKVNAIFAKTKDAMMRLSGIQEIAAEALQRFALIPQHIIRQSLIARNAGTINGTILWVNDAPPEAELVETYGEIEIVGNRVRIVD